MFLSDLVQIIDFQREKNILFGCFLSERMSFGGLSRLAPCRT